MLLTQLGTSFLCLEVSGRFKIKVRKKNHFDGGLGTGTKCRIFSKPMTYLTKTKHSLFSFTILTNLIETNLKNFKHKLLMFLLLNFLDVRCRKLDPPPPPRFCTIT